MPALLALRLITYLLVWAGVAALALAGLLGPVGGAILALALTGSWVIDQVRDRMPVRPLFAWALVVAAAVAIALAGLMFFISPRVGQATLPFRAELGKRISGFTDRVELGAYGEIETDQTVVMRVRFPDSVKDPELLPNLRWRGLAFDRFDGRIWEAAPRRRALLRRDPSGVLRVTEARGTGPLVRQEIFLDPIGADAVFAAPQALRIQMQVAAVGLDDMGSITTPASSARLQYTVDSELEVTPPRGLRGRLTTPAASPRLQYPVDSELELPPPRGLRDAAWPPVSQPPGDGRPGGVAQ